MSFPRRLQPTSGTPASSNRCMALRLETEASETNRGDGMQRNRRWTRPRFCSMALRMMTISLTTLATLAAVAPGAPARAAQTTALKVGISEAVNTVLAFWMAEDGGFFREQGLTVDIINMNGGSRGAQELQAGHI